MHIRTFRSQQPDHLEWRLEMFAALSTIIRLCCEAIAAYFARRAAIARLRKLDDRALRDIGIARCQIEAAVHGAIPRPGQGRL
jgi:uncharacterized protein YjiS (DUF1127 family)